MRTEHPYASFVERVEKPARYLGGEYQAVVKPWDEVRSRFVMCFPDVYDIGMSHLGTKILYAVVNRDPELLMERCFTPWVDMAKELTARGLPLVSLESARPLADFDVVGFSLQYELTFTNVLAMLDLGRVPRRSADRTLAHPLVIAGGPTATHPEPLAPFVDVFVIGDGEEALPGLLKAYAELKARGLDRTAILIELSKRPGAYVPALYERALCPRTGLLVVDRPKHPGVPARVERAFVDDISRFRFPDDSPVAVAEAIFDRMSVEIARGCTEGCRFCQAGMIYRPVRERDPEEVIETVLSAVKKGGYDEAAITSLSTADYSAVSPLVKRLMARLREEKVSLGISSLRAYGLSEDLLDEIATVKATGLTFAPEAGTQRMRDVINKNVTEADIETTCERVFSRGWQKMKLYFILGLPTETDEDVLGIAELGKKAVSIGRRHHRAVTVTVSTSSHVPKPHTPFQWAAMEPLERLAEKQARLEGLARPFGYRYRRHPTRVSYLECILARGDFRVADALEAAYEKGARFDSWEDQLDFGAWEAALGEMEARHGISRALFLGTLPLDGRLPWDHLDVGLEDGFLAKEYKKSLESRLSPPCGKPLGAQVHPTNVEDSNADRRKLVCYHCGIACDLSSMRAERIEFLTKLGAATPPAPRERTARGEALERIQKGQTPHDFKQGTKHRYRLGFRKLGPAALLGHLDLVRTLPQIVRRAGLPMAVSEGFSPKPILSFGPALALGVRSLAEYVDVSLLVELPEDELVRRLVEVAPAGLEFFAARRLAPGEPSVGATIERVELWLRPPPGAAELASTLAGLLDPDGGAELDVVRRRRGRKVRLLDYVEDLALAELDGEPGVRARVKISQAGGLKPVEIAIALFGSAIPLADIVRLGCFRVGPEGQWLSPLVAHPTPPVTA